MNLQDRTHNRAPARDGNTSSRAIGAALLAGVLFLAVTAYVQLRSPDLDTAAAALLDPYTSPMVGQLATDVTALGSSLITITIAITAGTLLLLLQHRNLAGLLAGGVIGSTLLSPVLKSFFNRSRPSLVDSPVFYASGSSYPSGHAMTGTVLLVLLVYVIHRLAADRPAITAVAALAAAILIALIAASRVYLGVHHPTDVMGGVAAGALWATLCTILARRVQGPPDHIH